MSTGMLQNLTRNASTPVAESFSSVAEGLQNASSQNVQATDLQDAIESFDGINGNLSNDAVCSADVQSMGPLGYLQSFDNSTTGGVQFFGDISSQDVMSQMQNPDLDIGGSLKTFADSVNKGFDLLSDVTSFKGEAVKQKESLMTSVLTNIANMRHESLKAIAQNLRG